MISARRQPPPTGTARPARAAGSVVGLAVAALIAILGFGGPSAAQTTSTSFVPPAVLRIAPDHAPARSTVSVSGNRCSQGDTVTLSIGETTLATLTAGAGGLYSGSLQLPRLETGEYTMYAKCGTLDIGATVTLTGTAAPGSKPASGSGRSLLVVLLLALLPILALVPAEIAGRKGANRYAYWAFGVVLLPVALAAALAMRPGGAAAR